MKSLMVRLLMLLTAAMLLAIPGPAMADDFDIGDLNRGILSDDLDNDIGDSDNLFGSRFNDDIGDSDNLFGSRFNHDFGDDGDNLRTIDVGDSECLVKEENDDNENFDDLLFGDNFNDDDDDDDDEDVLFCDKKQSAIDWLNTFFAQNDAEFNAAE